MGPAAKDFSGFRGRKFIYWLHWILIAVRGLSLVVESRGHTLVLVCRLLVAPASLLRGL